MVAFEYHRRLEHRRCVAQPNVVIGKGEYMEDEDILIKQEKDEDILIKQEQDEDIFIKQINGENNIIGQEEAEDILIK